MTVLKQKLKQATKAYDKYTDEQLNEFLKEQRNLLKQLKIMIWLKQSIISKSAYVL